MFGNHDLWVCGQRARIAGGHEDRPGHRVGCGNAAERAGAEGNPKTGLKQPRPQRIGRRIASGFIAGVGARVAGPVDRDDDGLEGAPFTTIANWAAYGSTTYKGKTYGQKREEFLSK